MPKYLDLDGLSYFWDKITGKFVAKETGKGLSTNDFTTALKTKVENSASETYVDTAVSNLKNYKSIVVTSAEQGTSFLLTATKNDDKVGVNLADNISVTQGTGDYPNMTISVDADENVIESISVNGTALTPTNKAVNIDLPTLVINQVEYKIIDIIKATENNISGVKIWYDDGSIDGSSIFIPDYTGMATASQQILTEANQQTGAIIANKNADVTDTPLMDGTADVGHSGRWAYTDHVHPTDTSRQATLVSGTNIKTVNNQSLLGSGNITIQGGGLSNDIKDALLDCFENVAWIGSDGATYYNALRDLFYPVASITAVFNQGTAVIYDTDSLDDLKQYLTVTANYEGGASEVVTGYTLSGTLAVGTSVVTVAYGGKTATFNVTVTSSVPSQADIFGAFTNGYAIGKGANSQYNIPQNSIWNNSTTARAAMTVPIENKGYVLTVTDASKYTLVVYDVTDDTPISTTYPNAVTGRYYAGGTKTISWKTSDSATTPYIMVSLKKNSGNFTSAELANGAEAVFTFTSTS